MSERAASAPTVDPQPRATGDVRRVLILGAGIFQLRLLQRARALGLQTHVVSRPGNYPGIAEADHFYPIDTTDVASVTELARALGVAAVLTAGTDVCIPTLGAVDDELGLPGLSQETAETISHKDRFRAFQQAHGLPAPRHVAGHSVEELQVAVRALAPPVIIKPVDASGSRGITRVTAFGADVIRRAFLAAVVHSRRRMVCAEEQVPGTEVGGNALLQGGRIAFLGVTAKHLHGFLVRGHHYPTDIGASDQERLQGAIAECCSLLGYRDGPLNFDVMVEGGTVCILELAARFGGNGLTDLTERAFGCDIETEYIRAALGEGLRIPPAVEVKRCGSLVFGSARRGVLTRLSNLPELQESCPWVLDLVTQRKPGDVVEKFESNADLVGYALFDLPSRMSWGHCRAAIEAALDLEVEP